MTVEELIAKLGFKVEGLGDVRKFEGALLGAKKAVTGVSTALGNTKLSGGSGLERTASAATKLTAGMRGAASASRDTYYAIGRTIRGVAIMATGFAGIATSIGTMVAGLIAARGIAAGLRRNLMLDAAQKRTKLTDIEKVQKGLGFLGADDKAASGAVDSVFKSADAAIKDPKSDEAKWFKDQKIPILDKRGNQLNSSAVLLDVIKNYLDRKERVDKLRAEYEAKPNPALGKKTNVEELSLRKDREKYPGITELFPWLDKQKNWREFRMNMEAQNRLNPVQTKEQEDATVKAAQTWAETSSRLKAIFDGLTDATARFADTLSNQVSQPLNNFLDTIIKKMKDLGIINRLPDEHQAKAEERLAANRTAQEDPEVTEARRAVANRSDGGLLGALLGRDNVEKAILRVKEAIDRYDTAKEHRDQAEVNKAPTLEKDKAEFWAAVKELAAAMREFKSQTEAKGEKDKGKGSSYGARAVENFRPSENIEDRRTRATAADAPAPSAPRQGSARPGQPALPSQPPLPVVDPKKVRAGFDNMKAAMQEVGSQAAATGEAMTASLSIKATPQVNTAQIDTAITKAQQLKSLLDGVSASAGAASRATASAAQSAISAASVIKTRLPPVRSAATV